MNEIIIDLTIVRHGNTNANRRWLVEGNTDRGLNSNGKHQGQLVAKRLRNEKFDQVCSSDLGRAFQTAAFIVKENCTFNDERKIERYPQLRERHFGVAERTMILQHRQNAKKAGFKGNLEVLTKYVPEGGESDEDVRLRVRGFLKELFEKRVKIKKPEWKVLITSHGITMREIVRCLIEDYGCSGISNNIMRNGRRLAKTPNTGITKFSLVLDKQNGSVLRGQCTLFQCKQHLESSNLILRKMEHIQQYTIALLEFLLALFLFFLSKVTNTLTIF